MSTVLSRTPEDTTIAALKNARVQRGQTQDDVARSVGTSRSFYSRVESGTATCTPDLARRLEEHFGYAVTRMQILWPKDYPGARTLDEAQKAS